MSSVRTWILADHFSNSVVDLFLFIIVVIAIIYIFNACNTSVGHTFNIMMFLIIFFNYSSEELYYVGSNNSTKKKVLREVALVAVLQLYQLQSNGKLQWGE